MALYIAILDRFFQRAFEDKARKFLCLYLSFMTSDRLHLKCKLNKIIDTKVGMYLRKGTHFLTFHKCPAIFPAHIQRPYKKLNFLNCPILSYQSKK
jgi:hypothetical protein